MAKAAAKTIKESPATYELVTEILKLNDKENELSVKLKETKAQLTEKTKELSGISTTIFNEDLGDFTDDRAPEIYGNHEYTAGSRIVTVNFKMKPGGFSLREISGHKACDLLPKMLGDKDYKKLFTESIQIEDDEAKLNQVADMKPGIVGHRIDTSKLPATVLDQLRRDHPDAFTPYIKDQERYLEEVSGVKTSVTVTTSTGFIGNVEKLPEEPRQKMRNLFRKIFTEAVTTAVKCGNKASA